MNARRPQAKLLCHCWDQQLQKSMHLYDYPVLQTCKWFPPIVVKFLQNKFQCLIEVCTTQTNKINLLSGKPIPIRFFLPFNYTYNIFYCINALFSLQNKRTITVQQFTLGYYIPCQFHSHNTVRIMVRQSLTV